ncbi:MAG TPA: adenylate/guanylate cyclase domain-containing protein, partial [Bradyrhizobium sp.]|nr:adenylate/guanylate cyclase domain-containing protein [Bradyrhizobium sp.]
MGETDHKKRLVAILAADAAGYSRLMAADEGATVAALDAARAVFRRQIEANHGRVIDMAGDSVLSVFELATGAVSAALAIQQQLKAAANDVPEDRRMRFRIGVHLGEIIEKDDGTIYGDGVNIAARLQALAEPGGVTVSESVRTAVRGKVTAAFEDKGEQTVKNIAHPVRAFAVRAAGDTAAKPVPEAGEIDLSLPDKPSIAVLPFSNMSGDPEQEYFTDGICEDIITELSRFQSLFVIARNSSFTYKGKAVDIKQVGKELGVRYVLEGSIRKAANRIRVTAQLIDTLTGGHIWAEKYDRVLEDIFAVQEEVTECIVGAIAPQVRAAETLRSRRRPGNLTAYELAVHAFALAAESQQKSDVAARDEALRLGREALVLDAQSVQALSAIGYAQWLHVAWRTTGDRHAAWREGMDAVMRALAIGPSSSLHAMRALLLAFAPGGGRWDEARIEAELAWRLNPQDFFALGPCGYILANTGQPLEGIRLLERALRINPRDPRAFFAYANLANAHLAAREYAKGLEWARRATGSAPNYGEAFLWTAALYVGLGDIDKAKSALERARALAPDYIQYLLQMHSRIETPTPRKPVDGGTESRRRIQIFLRIAAGLEAPSAAA